MSEPLVTHVGQELWYVPFDSRYVGHSNVVRVAKLGRKWAELEPDYQGACDIVTGWIKPRSGFSSTGRCWASKEAWEAERLRHAEWERLQRRLTHSPPEHLSLSEIRSLAATIFPNQSSSGSVEK